MASIEIPVADMGEACEVLSKAMAKCCNPIRKINHSNGMCTLELSRPMTWTEIQSRSAMVDCLGELMSGERKKAKSRWLSIGLDLKRQVKKQRLVAALGPVLGRKLLCNIVITNENQVPVLRNTDIETGPSSAAFFQQESGFEAAASTRTVGSAKSPRSNGSSNRPGSDRRESPQKKPGSQRLSKMQSRGSARALGGEPEALTSPRAASGLISDGI